MRTQNIGFIVLKTFFYDTTLDVIRFPFWWYTKGLVNVWKSFIISVANAERRVGVSIWAKNIMKPMFGQTDFWGRAISIIMRLLQILIRSIVLVVWVSLLLVKVVIWVLLPVVVTAQILYQISGGFFTQL